MIEKSTTAPIVRPAAALTPPSAFDRHFSPTCSSLASLSAVMAETPPRFPASANHFCGEGRGQSYLAQLDWRVAHSKSQASWRDAGYSRCSGRPIPQKPRRPTRPAMAPESPPQANHQSIIAYTLGTFIAARDGNAKSSRGSGAS